MVTSDERDDAAEDERFYEPLDEVVGDVAKCETSGKHLLEDRSPVQRARQAEIERGDDVAAEDPDEVVDDSEKWQHDQRCKNSWRNELLDRIRSERVQGVYLLGHAHRSKLGGDARAYSTSHHQPRQHRAQLAHHRARDQLADQSRLTERLELHGRLECEHHSGEKTGEEDDAEGSHSDHVHLLKEVGRVEGLDEDEAKRLSGQREELLQGLDAALCPVVESF